MVNVPVKNLKVIVTGAASGIGQAISELFLQQEGARVVMIDQIKVSVNDSHAKSVKADLSVTSECQDAAKQANEWLNGANVLINNAGVQHVAPIPEMPIEKWQHIIDLMLTAPFLLTQAVWSSMVNQGWGRIINIASVHGLVASANKSAYVSAKHGLIGLTKTTALEGSASGITANAICPGYVKTPLVENQLASQAKIHNMDSHQVIQDIMLKRPVIKSFIEADEVAQWVVFLCSNAASHMTGSSITLDGGWLAN